MKIEHIASKPDRAGRYWVRFSDQSTLGVYRQTVEDFELFPGKTLTDEEMETLRQEAGKMSARMRAVRILTASNVSSRDLQQRLIRKGENPEQAQEAVAWMTEKNLLDDSQTAAQIVARCVARGYGVSRARQMLYEKQIPRELWDEALASYPDQLEKIVAFLRERLEAHPQQRDIKRATDALQRRGHSWNDIRRGLNCVLQDGDFQEEV